MSSNVGCAECGSAVPADAPKRRGWLVVLCSEKCRRSYRKAYHKRWFAANRQRELANMSARVKAYHLKHPDYFKKHYAKNSERRKKESQAWYRANAEYAAHRQRAYDLRHPEQIREMSRRNANKRRALKAKVFVEVVDPKVVFTRDKGVCGICKRPVDPKSPWEVDHMIPISRGGTHCYANVQLAHRTCNRSKAAKVITQPNLFQVLA